MRHQKYFRFLAPHTHFAAIWCPVGVRARDALPGGVSGMWHHGIRFRANREILSPSRTLFEDFRHFYKES
jgi:hypothetical protein